MFKILTGGFTPMDDINKNVKGLSIGYAPFAYKWDGYYQGNKVKIRANYDPSEDEVVKRHLTKDELEWLKENYYDFVGPSTEYRNELLKKIPTQELLDQEIAKKNLILFYPHEGPIKIKYCPVNSTIRIINAAGEIVQTFNIKESSKTVKWDGKDAHWMPAEACDLV